MADYGNSANRSAAKGGSRGWKIAAIALAVCLAGSLALTGFAAGIFVMRVLPQGILSRASETGLPAPTRQAAGEAQATPAPMQTANGGVVTSSGQVVDIPAIVRLDAPAVVGVLNKVKNPGGNSVDATQGTGSGVILSTDGYIVTNNHVVEGADSVSVVLMGGEEVPATVVGADAQTDLAVLKIDRTGLTAITIGDSDALEVGETVVAIGNPLGMDLAGTVTSGILSAKDRYIEIDTFQFKLLQTDAAINPGNSGGALVNSRGELIGINSSKSTSAGVDQYGMPISAEGIGFAIPINDALPIIDQLRSEGGIRRPQIGIYPIEVTEQMAEYYQTEPGVYIRSLSEGGPAMKAGLQAGDRIVEFNGVAVKTVAELRAEIAKCAIGGTAMVKVFRDTDRREHTYDLTLVSSEEIQ